MIEIDTDPNFPDRRPGSLNRCYVSTNLDIRGEHSIDDLEVGMAVMAVQPENEDEEPDFIAPGVIEEIITLEGSDYGITHFIYTAVDNNGWHDRPEA